MNPQNLEKQNNSIEQKKITSIETSQGSLYRYLEDGRTQRFKKVENKEYEPQDVIAFIPDWKTIQRIAAKEFLEKFDNNRIEFEQVILDYCTNKKVYIVNETGHKIVANYEKAGAKQLFVAFCQKDATHVDFVVPVSPDPKIGYSPCDTRKYFNESTAGWERETHIGNEVVRISY